MNTWTSTDIVAGHTPAYFHLFPSINPISHRSMMSMWIPCYTCSHLHHSTGMCIRVHVLLRCFVRVYLMSLRSLTRAKPEKTVLDSRRSCLVARCLVWWKDRYNMYIYIYICIYVNVIQFTRGQTTFRNATISQWLTSNNHEINHWFRGNDLSIHRGITSSAMVPANTGVVWGSTGAMPFWWKSNGPLTQM